MSHKERRFIKRQAAAKIYVSGRGQPQQSIALEYASFAPTFQFFGDVQEALRNLPPSNELVPTTQDFVAGEIIDWQSPTACEDLVNQLPNRKSPVVRLINSLSANHNQYANESFQILADDLENLSHSPANSPHLFKAWWYKLRFGFSLLPTFYAESMMEEMMQQKFSMPQRKRYLTLVEEQISRLQETLQGLSSNQLENYIDFSDLYLRSQLRPWIPQASSGPPNNIADVISQAMLKTADRVAQLREVDQQTWTRLRENWGWGQVQIVLGKLPKVQSDLVVFNLIAALETNFLTSEKLMQETPVNLSIEAEDLLYLLRSNASADLTDQGYFKRDYPELTAELDNKLELDAASVPNKYMPLAAIFLLSRLQREGRGEEVAQVVSDLGSQLIPNKDQLSNYVLLILALRRISPQVASEFANLINNCQNLSIGYKQTLLDQIPGKVVVDSDGRLRLSNSVRPAPKTHVVYTSAA